MINEELVEKFQDHNIFIGDIIRAPKVKKVSKGKDVIRDIICLSYIIVFWFFTQFN